MPNQANSSRLPRVIIFEHPPLNKEGIGKTLYAFFYRWQKKDLAQVYTVDLPVDESLCNYFALFGSNVSRNDSIPDAEKRENKREGVVFRLLSWISHTGFGTILRNRVFKRQLKNNKELNTWLKRFEPQCVFFGIGELVDETDYVINLAKEMEIPLVLYVSDDYFTKWTKKRLHPFYRNRVLKSFKAAIERSSSVVLISEKMQRLYETLFPSAHYYVASNSAERKKSIFENEKKENEISFCYTGNLGLGRWKTISLLSKAIKEYNSQVTSDARFSLYVYSQESPGKRIISKITNEFSKYKQGVFGNELENVRQTATILLFVEGFERKYQSILSTALSTKVPEYLSYGKAIAALGPQYAWSIEYLHENQAAICHFSKKNIVLWLKTISIGLSNGGLESMKTNALSLYMKNHIFQTNADRFCENIKTAERVFMEEL